jgi:hypothetical protein
MQMQHRKITQKVPITRVEHSCGFCCLVLGQTKICNFVQKQCICHINRLASRLSSQQDSVGS